MFGLASRVGLRGGRAVGMRWYSTHASPLAEKKVTLLDVAKKHKDGRPLTMVTAYDYTSAYFVDKADVDIILVGDSLGMVMLGRNSTTEVTMDEMLHHCKAVSRGTKRAFLVGDMPFGSFEISISEAIRNACRLVKEGLMSAVKLEGGKHRKDTVRAIVEAGIPVIGHIGLTPQTSGPHGGFRVHGKTARDAAAIYEDAIALQEAGCSGLVLEFVPEVVGEAITKAVSIPTFGIGAGRHTSGQVLVYHDLLGMYPDFTPKFCKKYSNVGEEIGKALTSFRQEVEGHQFPAVSHTFSMKTEEWAQAQQLIAARHPDMAAQVLAISAQVPVEKAQVSAEKAQVASEKAQVLASAQVSAEKAQVLVAKLTSAQVSSEKAQAPAEKAQVSRVSAEYERRKPAEATIASRIMVHRDEAITNFELYYNSYFGSVTPDDEILDEDLLAAPVSRMKMKQ